MATAIKVKKILEILFDGEQVERDALPVGAYVLSTARGVYKYTLDEQLFLDDKARREDEKKKHRKPDPDPVKPDPVEPDRKSDSDPVEPDRKPDPNPVEPDHKSDSDEDKIAKEHGLTKVKPDDFPVLYRKGGCFYVWLPRNKAFMSLSPMTNENGDASLGEKPVVGKSVKWFNDVLSKFGAKTPNFQQYDEFFEILKGATSSTTVGGFNHVCGFISLANQLCSKDGKWMTYLGEYKSLVATLPWFCLESRIVF